MFIIILLYILQCSIIFYHKNVGVMQGFPALRKAVTIHVKRFYYFLRVFDIANQLLIRHSPFAPLGQVNEWAFAIHNHSLFFLYHKQNNTCLFANMKFLFSCSIRHLNRSLLPLVNYRVKRSLPCIIRYLILYALLWVQMLCCQFFGFILLSFSF